jgi:uncharacterized OB-fold protein
MRRAGLVWWLRARQGLAGMTPMQEMATHAKAGRLALQRCTACEAVQYPPRELCGLCLADALEWRVSDSEPGEVLATTRLHHSQEARFRAQLPLWVGLVCFDVGPTVVCFLAEGCAAGARVLVSAGTDDAGRAVMTARPVDARAPGAPRSGGPRQDRPASG